MARFTLARLSQPVLTSLCLAAALAAAPQADQPDPGDPPRSTKELKAELRKLAKGREGAFAQLQLAQTAHGYGLKREMWKFLDLCVEAMDEEKATAPAVERGQDAGNATERRLRAFLVTLEPEILDPEKYRDATTRRRVRGLVRQIRSTAGPGKRAAIVELLVAEQGADETLAKLATTEPLPEQRLAALQALQRRNAEAHGTLIRRRAVWDKDKDLRAQVATMVRDQGDTSRDAAVRQLSPGLMHDMPAIRQRTASALGNLGGAEAAAILVVAGPLAGVPASVNGGFGVRANMSSITSRSYIRDFDVEIAQAAAVANPVVGQAQSGVVLDVNVAAVITERVQIVGSYRRALRDLTGSDPGADPGTWRGWLAGADAEAGALLPPSR